MAHRHKVHHEAKAAKAGHSKGVHHAEVAYGNEEVIKEAKSTSDGPGVKAIQKKDGGKVPEAKATGGRLDKRARGGKIGKFARGGSPFSAAAKVKK